MARKVVIVEGGAEYTEQVQQLRTHPAYEVVLCPVGPQTLPCIQQAQPSVVIVDLRMPSMDGIDLIQVLRFHPATASLPVVLVSSPRYAVGLLLDQLKAQRIYLLSRPFTLDQLATAIEEAAAMAARPAPPKRR
jgi:two-component system NtrC family response regulator